MTDLIEDIDSTAAELLKRAALDSFVARTKQAVMDYDALAGLEDSVDRHRTLPEPVRRASKREND